MRISMLSYKYCTVLEFILATGFERKISESTKEHNNKI
jgi:hypothetical protein